MQTALAKVAIWSKSIQHESEAINQIDKLLSLVKSLPGGVQSHVAKSAGMVSIAQRGALITREDRGF